MNKARIEHYLTEIQSWEVSPPSIGEAQKATKGLMSELFPNLRRDHIYWLAGNFMATHYKENEDDNNQQ
ncbi:hypothetical protein JAO10_09390 [Burkholderia contaminans]|uniref:hypothetical protein n=1 Tax=Burkholderia contaminans TaxID=488447 RepID=UPI0018DD820D|nr:hypothetical protein [Burkholderia contaminans]MBH9720546.1 hypothetical protein [Burkholderia contaminans]